MVVQPRGAFEPAIRRVGSVLVASALLAPSTSLKAGDELVLEVFPQIAYTVLVEQVSLDINNTLSLLGKVNSEEFSSFVLNADAGNVLVRFQDNTTAALFAIVRNAADAAGTVTEFDVTKMPPVTDLPAVIVAPPDSSPQ